MLVFIDDSGDPGFRVAKGSSKVFVIALVVFNDDLEAEKTSLAIKELRRALKKSDFFEFKFNKADKKIKEAFFDTVKNFKFKVRAIAVSKSVIYSPKLRADKESFYNYIIMQVLRNSVGIKNARLKFDKFGEREIRDQLRVYLSRELDNKNNSIFKDLKFVDSRQNTLIQLADMVAGCINESFSKNRSEYLDVLKKSGRIGDIWSFK